MGRVTWALRMLRARERSKMSNPWLKKNPFMSAWLSTANRVAGSVRAQATAEARRQVKAVVAEAFSPPTPTAKPRRKR